MSSFDRDCTVYMKNKQTFMFSSRIWNSKDKGPLWSTDSKKKITVRFPVRFYEIELIAKFDLELQRKAKKNSSYVLLNGKFPLRIIAKMDLKAKLYEITS
jgi:hypothetical protein